MTDLGVFESNGVSRQIRQRLREFKELHKRPSSEWFSELCFCISVANASAKRGIKLQKTFGHKIHKMKRSDIEREIRRAGLRFHRNKARFILDSARHRSTLKETVKSFGNERDAREWLVQNIYGLGYKEASHFLRNVGYDNVAILDRHIISYLKERGMFRGLPKSLTRKAYLKLENKLEKEASKMGVKLSELDLHIWFSKTGKVLK